MRNDEQLALVKVGPGTPSGEVFRRYWLPVEVAINLGGRSRGDLHARNPLKIKMLGESLVLYRDESGRPHLLAEHCSHRGTSLSYGRVEGDCIRCIYHGWLYDGEGNVMEMPAEPPTSLFKEKVKHPAYPCVEVGGLIFAYLGPKDRMPVFPKYHHLFSEDGIRVTGNGGYIEHCNVFQALHDNTIDPWHNEIAHGWFKNPPRKGGFEWGEDGKLLTPLRWDRTPWGTRYATVKRDRRKADTFSYHETHLVLPTQRCNFANARSQKWAVPVDDIHTRWFTVDFFPLVDGGVSPQAQREIDALNDPMPNIGLAHDLPRDWAQQVGSWWNFGHPWRQGNVWEDEVSQQTQSETHYCDVDDVSNFPNWENFHLGTSDEGMILNRKVWTEQIARVREGGDPIGVDYDPTVKTVEDAIEAGGDEMIRLTADDIGGLSWDEAKHLYDMSAEQRLEYILSKPGHDAGLMG